MDFFRKMTDKSKALALTLGLSAANILIVLILGLWGYSFELKGFPVFLCVISAVLLVLHIPAVIICRIKKKLWIVRGWFCYQMIGIVCFVIFFCGYVGSEGGSNGLTQFYVIFNSWTLHLQPCVVVLSRFIGIPLKYVLAIVYMVRTYITGNTYLNIKKDIRYEREMEENRRLYGTGRFD